MWTSYRPLLIPSDRAQQEGYFSGLLVITKIKRRPSTNFAIASLSDEPFMMAITSADDQVVFFFFR